TPMEDNFGINNVALVDGQPRTLGLKNLLRVYVDFRTDVVCRRSAYRLRKREERLHLVEGLLIAILDIDEVIQVIRASDDAAIAKARLMDVFDLSDPQATYILDLQLRRLTKFSRVELEREKAELERQIEALQAILSDEKLLLKTVSNELADVAKAHGTPRRTVLLESAGTPVTSATPLELTDDPCWVLLSSTGLMARTTNVEELPSAGARHKHDVVTSAVQTTIRGHVALVTSRGRMIRLAALDLPILPPTNGTPSLSGGAPLGAFVDLPKDEQPLILMSLSPGSHGLALGTAQGVVKRVTPDYPGNRDDWEIVSLKKGDALVGAAELLTGAEHLVFITSDAQLLHFPAASVRPQGRSAAGMAGIKLAAGAQAVFFSAVNPLTPNLVVTSSGSSGALPGTEAGSLKVTPYEEYPAKGRGTGGVRCHRFLRGEDTLILGWVGGAPAKAAAANGVALELPEPTGKRDGSGLPAAAPIGAIAPPPPRPRDLPATCLPAPSLPDPTTDDLLLSLELETTPEFPAGKE
ncbi:MAG TPA: DNA gyrase subunit A, partial [Dermatophilaceae bacterium]